MGSHVSMHRVDVSGGVYDPESIRFPAGQLEVSIPDDPVELQTLPLKPIFAGNIPRTARAIRNPGEPRIGRDIKEKGEVGLQRSGRKVAERPGVLYILTSAIPLVGKGGIGKTITQHNRAPFHRGGYDLFHMLGSVRGK
jgi:hypothetical protein